jgi:hypothetical protein
MRFNSSLIFGSFAQRFGDLSLHIILSEGGYFICQNNILWERYVVLAAQLIDKTFA